MIIGTVGLFGLAAIGSMLTALGIAAVLIASIIAAWFGLFGDPARGRRRCPRCWHDLSATPGRTCGECGHTARTEAHLGRSRRRPVLAALGLLGATAAGLVIGDRISEGHWTRLIPDGLLLPVYAYAGNPGGAVLEELRRRFADGELSSADADRMLQAALTGDRFAQPPDPAWLRRYALLAERLADTISRDPAGEPAALRRRFVDVLCAAPPTVHAAAAPDGSAFIRVEVRDWWPTVSAGDLELDLTLTCGDVTEHSRFRLSRRNAGPAGFTLWSGISMPSWNDAQLHIRARRRADTEDPWRESGRLTVPVSVSAPGEDDAALVPTDDPQIEDALRSVFGGGLIHHAEGTLPVRISIDRRATATPEFDDHLFGVEVEVRRNAIPVRRLASWWAGGEVRFTPGAPAFEVPWYDEALLAPPPAEGESWTLSIRGRADLARRAGHRGRVWLGAFEMPVRIESMLRPAPPSVWLPVPRE